MLKLIKYELKTVSRDVFIIAIVEILLNLALMTRVNVWPSKAIFWVSFLITFGAGVSAFISNIMIYTRELKQDTGYLTFTLPKKGYSVVGEKIIVALIESFIIWFIGIGFLLFFDTWLSTNFIKISFNIGIIIRIISTLYEYAAILIIIYFVNTLSKVILKNRRFNGLFACGIFAVFMYAIYKVEEFLDNIFPQRIVVIGGKIKILSGAISAHNYGDLSSNIVSSTIEIIVVVGLFIATSRILEKHMDL